MPTSTPIIDLHTHPTLKPYGNKFYESNNPELVNDPSCVWYKDTSTIFDRLYENILGISRYRQSDFSTLTESQYRIVCVSLYPIEKEFFDLRQKYIQKLSVFIGQFSSLLGKERIKYVKSNAYDYFIDLQNEYAYLKKFENRPPMGGARTYDIINNCHSITTPLANIKIIITIEGCHVFCEGTDVRNPDNWRNLKNNVILVKQWETPPFFITFAHHFFNGLCTHAKSLFDTAGDLLNQEYGMRNEGFKHKDKELPISDLGKILIDYLLDENIGGRRILIDVKHMSKEARKEYYSILEIKNKENIINGVRKIPVIWSHGGVDHDNCEINLDLKVDVKQIYETNGIIGIEMDQRILGYNKKAKRFKRWLYNIFANDAEQCLYEAHFFWDQVITIAEYAYNELNDVENPWRCIALGSDYDGVINPLNGYRHAGTMPILYNNLILLAKDYISNPASKIKIPKYIDEQDIVYKIMYENAYNFIQANY